MAMSEEFHSALQTRFYFLMPLPPKEKMENLTKRWVGCSRQKKEEKHVIFVSNLE